MFLCLLFYAKEGWCQKSYPQDYFQSPLDIPLFLAGNFGEIRTNHFHGGIDIKTQSQEGKNVLAAADGYVSRIKISEGGYGKALYITHPNGYTTVYAHLQRFEDRIEAFVRKAQYRKQRYEIEVFPGENVLSVKQGDLVALSGNTGGSGGPHLHFEIRDTKSEVPINPLLFGFEIKDEIRPIVQAVSFYPMDEQSLINGKNKPLRLSLFGSYGKYTISSKSIPTLQGTIGFAIETFDRLNGFNNRCGVYDISLKVDGKPTYAHRMEKVGYHETRYMNCHIDYAQRKKYRRDIQRNFIADNNKLGIYYDVENRGKVIFSDDKNHDISYIIKDVYGNTSTVHFQVKAKPIQEHPPSAPSLEGTFFNYNKENLFENEEVKVHLKKNLLYENLIFEYRKEKGPSRYITPIHHIHNTSVPLHSYMTLSIKVDDLKPEHHDKALIVALNNDNKLLAPEGGKYKNGFIIVETRSLGPYTVMLDTVPPRIVPLNISANYNMSGSNTIEIKISDNLSGIGSYNAYIDGKWVLMEYERKRKRLTHHFGHLDLSPGKHAFKLVVTDNRGNSKTYKANFTR